VLEYILRLHYLNLGISNEKDCFALRQVMFDYLKLAFQLQ
jgi:hypothetical protein